MSAPLVVDAVVVGLMAGSYALDFAVAVVRRRAAGRAARLSRRC
ncbi:MAG: hypothetical protein QOD63_78 [Actinomycetota bacterium]|nr:hypothetical protein [Actinomycetota bacterium]